MQHLTHLPTSHCQIYHWGDLQATSHLRRTDHTLESANFIRRNTRGDCTNCCSH